MGNKYLLKSQVIISCEHRNASYTAAQKLNFMKCIMQLKKVFLLQIFVVESNRFTQRGHV